MFICIKDEKVSAKTSEIGVEASVLVKFFTTMAYSSSLIVRTNP